ncbi:MAG: HDOD domain-containing protein [Algicola sp.]|nr:HDOD domain-containing protein [Algicola sp.]
MQENSGVAMFEVDEKVLDNIKRSFTIPSKPELLIDLQNQLKLAEPDINLISDIISKDVGIAAGVLRVVNSAAFGLPRSVTDIKQAAMFLGFGGVHSVVIALVLKQSMSKHTCCISLDSFWDKACNVANVAMFIAKHFKDRIAPEDVYTAALFQDCGIPAMALKFQDYFKILKVADKTVKYTLAELEERKYKTNHAVVGYFISSTWQLPRPICQQVLRHHDRTFLSNLDHSNDQLIYAVIKLAENAFSHHHNGEDTPDWSYCQESVLEVLEFDDDELKDIVEDIEELLV